MTARTAAFSHTGHSNGQTGFTPTSLFLSDITDSLAGPKGREMLSLNETDHFSFGKGRGLLCSVCHFTEGLAYLHKVHCKMSHHIRSANSQLMVLKRQFHSNVSSIKQLCHVFQEKSFDLILFPDAGCGCIVSGCTTTLFLCFCV